ncbi:hypothetical protein HUG10_20935 (plasmid) [Halorarum halophilum]|uniref:ATP-dependent DNA ligase family profile domain-containing protein n=1 Tax=Halorarum halophilum TaxID=2743090 RepID=A0A7D5H423_9EURY|nr:hypothetical protein [Halobaculum halophilum]QLG30053.1 hypothetical protein HUG10_20935 [Halobaculum halophilum]
MDLTEFGAHLEELQAGEKSKDDVILRALRDINPSSKHFSGAIALLTRKPFDDIGVGKKSLRKLATTCFDVTHDELRDLEREYGDLPSAIGHVDLKTNTLTLKRKITLGELYDDLEYLRRTSGPEQKRRMKEMLGYDSPKWVAHAMLGKKGVSLGVGEKSVVKTLAIENGYDEHRKLLSLNPDVTTLCHKLTSPDTDPRSEPGVGHPFLPMLAKSKEVPPDPDGDWMIQPKYDGARILVHIKNGELRRAFSRNANRVDESLPELREFVDDVFATGDWILDGEAIPYKDGERQPFQAIMTRFGRQEAVDEQEIDVEFKFFDLVYGGGVCATYPGDLSNETASRRIHLLRVLFGPEQEYVAPTYRPDTHEKLNEYYQSFLDDGLEGAVVKHVDAPYEFDRRSPNWRKMIPTKENVELRITAVHEGENSNAGKVGGMKLETEDGVPVGHVGGGMEGHSGIPWEERDDIIDKIVEVSWRELQENDDGTYALRFPSLEGFRADKDEADSLDKILSA